MLLHVTLVRWSFYEKRNMEEDVVQVAPTVSVIVPVYNCAPYLRQCLDSVVAQTECSWEIIAVDDGSTDGSIALLREYEERLDGKMRVVEQENAGPARARNCAIDMAQGKYFAFLDADDFLDPRCFELAVGQAECTEAQIVAWDIWFFNDRHQRIQHPPLGILHFAPFDADGQPFSWRKCPDAFLLSFQTWPWNKLYLASYIREGGYRFQEDVMRSEDIGFVYPALVDAERIATVGERLINYRVMRADSAMATKDKHPFDFIVAIASFREYLLGTGHYEELERSYVTWAMSSILYNLHTLSSFDAFCAVYDYLGKQGIRDLGLLDCPKEAFLDPAFYDKTREIVEWDAAHFLFDRSRALDFAREDALAMLDFTSAERDAACAREAAVRADLDRVVSEFDAVMGAAEQRVGQAICRLPRAIQRKVGASKR